MRRKPTNWKKNDVKRLTTKTNIEPDGRSSTRSSSPVVSTQCLCLGDRATLRALALIVDS